MMKIVGYSDIDKIKKEEWDQFLTPDDWYHSWDFMKIIAGSDVMNARYRFLLFYNNDELVGTCTLSEFEINLCLFVGNSKLIKLIRSFYSKFLYSRLLVCGTPCSMGQKNLFIKHPEYTSNMIEQLNKYMDDYCRVHHIGVSIYKEFGNNDLKLIEHNLIKHGYFRFFSIPSIEFTNKFICFNDFIGSLRAPFRRQIKQSLKKINCTEPVFDLDYFNGKMDEANPVFTVLDPDIYKGSDFFHLYERVMERTTVKFETLNINFFNSFFEVFRDRLKLLGMVFKGEILGVYVLMPTPQGITFIWAGKTFHKNNFDTYFNLMTSLVAYGINTNSGNMILGQTAYYSKMKIGGTPSELFGFFKAGNKMVHLFFKLLNPILFPKLKLAVINSLKK